MSNFLTSIDEYYTKINIFKIIVFYSPSSRRHTPEVINLMELNSSDNEKLASLY